MDGFEAGGERSHGRLRPCGHMAECGHAAGMLNSHKATCGHEAGLLANAICTMRAGSFFPRAHDVLTHICIILRRNVHCLFPGGTPIRAQKLLAEEIRMPRRHRLLAQMQDEFRK